MSYYLGIDIGTTYTAAAVWRDGRYEIASLGNRAPTIPSVVLLRDDESVLTGEAAARRAATEPGRVAREFKRRVGDPTPIIVGGTPYSADALIAKLLRWVVGQVSEVEGGPPAGIAVSHPANWGNYKLDLLRQAIRLADLDGVATLTEPEAAAIHYASQARVEPGSVIAVYDLGGGTFDAAVLRKTGEGWQILGSPEGIERLGGVDFDQAVFHHVAQALGGAIEALDPDEPGAQAAVARLRQECIDAKEALSSDSDVSIPVMLPNLQTEVRLTRAEYEGMVRPALSDTITAMHRALRSADVTAAEVTAVLLVGGSSRTPLVAELVSSALGRPVAVDAHPKYGVALGAAITAATAARAGRAGRGAPPTKAEAATAPHEPGPTRPEARTAGREAPAAGRGGRSDGRDPRSVTVPYGGDVGDRGGSGPGGRASTGTATPAAGAGREARPAISSSDRDRDRDRDRVPPAGGRAAHGAGSGGGGGRARRSPIAVLAALVVIAGVAGAALWAISSGDDDPGGAVAGQADATNEASDGAPDPTVSPETTPTTDPLPPEYVQIREVVLEGSQYRVNYEVLGYEPRDDGVPGSLHVHFFPDTQPAATAGTNGNHPVDDWRITDEPTTYLTDYTRDTIGEGATQMCAAVADHQHAVHTPEVRTGNCVDLPT